MHESLQSDYPHPGHISPDNLAAMPAVRQAFADERQRRNRPPRKMNEFEDQMRSQTPYSPSGKQGPDDGDRL